MRGILVSALFAGVALGKCSGNLPPASGQVYAGAITTTDADGAATTLATSVIPTSSKTPCKLSTPAVALNSTATRTRKPCTPSTSLASLASEAGPATGAAVPGSASSGTATLAATGTAVSATSDSPGAAPAGSAGSGSPSIAAGPGGPSDSGSSGSSGGSSSTTSSPTFQGAAAALDVPGLAVLGLFAVLVL